MFEPALLALAEIVETFSQFSDVALRTNVGIESERLKLAVSRIGIVISAFDVE